MDRPDMKDILIIGHSHIFALFAADTTGRYAWQHALPHFARLRTKAYRPELVDGRLNPAIEADLGRPGLRAVVSLIGGNVHSVLGLTNHPQPFDLILPQAPDLPRIDGAETLPYGLVQEVIAQRAAGPFELFEALCAATDLPIWQAEPPPPIPSETHIRSHPAEFAERIEAQGVAPALLRYKLWRAHSALMQARAAARGAGFLPAPPEFCDDQGMLKPKGRAQDPVHAGPAYGAAVLAQIDKLAAELD